ncbi:MAG: hypothetical protein R3Y50_08045 [Rikenellaceae bacterium]
MKELVVTETIQFEDSSKDSHYEYPIIQSYLDCGYTIKNIFCIPFKSSYVVGISVTAHLQKSE